MPVSWSYPRHFLHLLWKNVFYLLFVFSVCFFLPISVLISVFRFWFSNFGFPISIFRFRFSDFCFPMFSDFSFLISVFRFQFSDFGFPISGFQFRFSNFGFPISVFQFRFSNLVFRFWFSYAFQFQFRIWFPIWFWILMTSRTCCLVFISILIWLILFTKSFPRLPLIMIFLKEKFPILLICHCLLRKKRT